MSNISIVIGREYMTRVKKKSFIILTILMPFIIVGLGFVPFLLGMIKSSEKQDVVLLDQTGRYAPAFYKAQKVDSTRSEGYNFVPAKAPLADYQKAKNEDGDAADVIVLNITDDLVKNPDAVKIYSNKEIQHDLLKYVENLLTEEIRKDKVKAYNIPGLEAAIDDLEQDFTVSAVKWSQDGSEKESSTDIAMALGVITAFLIYMFVMMYGAMVLQGVTEEKANRIVEVLVCSVKPFDLMMGKIIGILLVGLTQIAIWGVMLVSLSTIAGVAIAPPGAPAAEMTQTIGAQDASTAMSPSTAMAMAEDSPAQDILNAVNNLPVGEIALLFIFYFLGGYLMYSSFYAAIGAAVNSQEDSSQFMMPMMFIMIFSLYAAMGSMENTNGPLAFWASIFPLTSPIVMMVRLPFDVPLWQEVLSLVILYATAIGSIWVAAKIYRVGILMYGKKPTFKDMWKWLRYC